MVFESEGSEAVYITEEDITDTHTKSWSYIERDSNA
jgi:hypothetical protein